MPPSLGSKDEPSKKAAQMGWKYCNFVDKRYHVFFKIIPSVINISYNLKYTILPTQIYLLKVNVIRHNFHTTPLEVP
jgi:hypothetical protein